MTFIVASRRLAGFVVVAALPAASVLAAGLGTVGGAAVMGERLHLEIPLIRPDSLNGECYRLQPSPDGSDPEFFPRRASLKVAPGGGGKAPRLVIEGPPVDQPVVEFQVAIVCDAAVARNFVLFSAPGRDLNYPLADAPAAALATTAAAIPPGEAPRPRPPRMGPSLDQMAGSRYPDRADLRAEFKNRLRRANAQELQSYADDAPIPLATPLAIPPDIEPDFMLREKPPAPARAAKQAARVHAARTEKPPTPPAGDRLSIGAGYGASPGSGAGKGNSELAGKLDASFGNQDDLVARLAQSEAAFAELKEGVLRMESRMAALEQERQRLEAEARKKADGSVMQAALAIFGGGLIGALAMIALRRRRNPATF